MGDVLKLATEWLNAHPRYAWLPVIAVCLLVVLTYETVKNLLPKLLEKGASSVWRSRATAAQRIRIEAAMRNLCIISRDRNWASTLPAVARYGLDIPLSDIFVLPRLATGGGAGGRAQEIGEILGDHRTLCVTGAPGAGKSTLINSLAIAFAREDTAVRFRLVEARIPICFDFQEFVELGEGKPLEVVLSILFDRHGVAVPVDHLRTLLEEGRCAIFLDGLDEAGDAHRRRNILSWVIDSLSAFSSSNNRLVVTCRSFEWDAGATPGVARAIIQPFSVEQARAFVGKFRKALERRSGSPLSDGMIRKFDALVEELDDDHRFLSSNPMLLTLAVALLTLDIPIPKKRAEILSHFVRTMLVDWGHLKKRAATLAPEKGLLPKLERVGYCSLLKQDDPGTVRVRDRFIAEAISKNADEATAWLDQIASGSGILARFSDSHWAFTNRRILEYLAASELSRNPGSWTAHSGDAAWKEVFTFLPEITPDGVWYLNWLRRLGPPKDDLHATLLVRAALALTTSESTERAEFAASIEDYMLSSRGTVMDRDPDLARGYIRLDPDRFLAAVHHEMAEIGGAASPPHLTVLALRSGHVPAARHIAAGLGLLGSNVSWMVKMLPDVSPSVRMPLLEALLASDRPASDLADSFVKCGRDALTLLTAAVAMERDALRRSRLIAMIAAFPDPLATTILFDLSERGQLSEPDRSFLPLNVRLVAETRGESAGDLLDLGAPSFYQRYGKRGLDLVVAGVSILPLLPLAAMIAIAIKLDSRGPVFFASRRQGRAAHGYGQLKFRTIRTDLQNERAETTSRRDARITRVGLVLRRTSLDELPALFNVLKGDASIIGPRPLPLYYADRASPVSRLVRSRLRPGIFGISQTRFRDVGTEFLGHQDAEDLEYLTRCSLSYDLLLLGRLVRQIIFPRGSY